MIRLVGCLYRKRHKLTITRNQLVSRLMIPDSRLSFKLQVALQ